jgi:hypothetical protein
LFFIIFFNKLITLVSSIFKDDEIKFNSAIYHSLLSPTKWSEANGIYLGFGKINIFLKLNFDFKLFKIYFLLLINLDFNVHIKPSYMDHVYTDLSIWDVHRT